MEREFIMSIYYKLKNCFNAIAGGTESLGCQRYSPPNLQFSYGLLTALNPKLLTACRLLKRRSCLTGRADIPRPRSLGCAVFFIPFNKTINSYIFIGSKNMNKLTGFEQEY
jgi:hypothetical protein